MSEKPPPERTRRVDADEHAIPHARERAGEEQALGASAAPPRDPDARFADRTNQPITRVGERAAVGDPFAEGRDGTIGDVSKQLPQNTVPTHRGGTAHQAGSAPDRADELRGYAMIGATIAAIVLALLIGWIPLVGPLIVGLVGGYLARQRWGGMFAMFVPAIICSAWIALVAWLPDFPPLRPFLDSVAPIDVIVSGATGVVFALVLMSQFLICIVAGWMGGVLSERRFGPPNDPGRAGRGATR